MRCERDFLPSLPCPSRAGEGGVGRRGTGGLEEQEVGSAVRRRQWRDTTDGELEPGLGERKGERSGTCWRTLFYGAPNVVGPMTLFPHFTDTERGAICERNQGGDRFLESERQEQPHDLNPTNVIGLHGCTKSGVCTRYVAPQKHNSRWQLSTS
jgi:hypothetical protein